MIATTRRSPAHPGVETLARPEARAEAVHAADQRLAELLALGVVEVREHGVLHVGDGAIARREHLVAAVAERDLDDAAVVGGGRADDQPVGSSAASTSFIDCGVT